mmetsp:Transcript_33484/g.73454  ORF Transcript_33484/g.73454 Transcript_33484/m.73454 type:complete len:571 (+) Transcript_33484:148-1860(+)|eukprot:CAMPEP_0178519404 /NCGR_PEP_ID=MMETSP0696-20121128/26808_1 /TAXON_ID=265572 /ORGANISM="Extubocellulus spinifer, Strain CCMP396" /LENGTH=570 /DNA_ID=CAMNT_0020150103 /DNA_START=137 /DNA_END=1849 /DNA_ORIENTATION=+
MAPPRSNSSLRFDRAILQLLLVGVILLVGSPLLTAAHDDHTAMQYDAGPPMQANRLHWVSTGCPDGIDYCGMIEFCEDTSDFPNVVFGYRHPCHDDEVCECHAGPGPTIRLEAGNKYLLTLRNAAENVASVTNLHTHGLHIIGAGNGDDVTRVVNGDGNCLDYVWDILDDHPGGTYWYHAHHHGFTEPQVNGGAYGMVIVEDNKMLNPDTPAWATNEVLLMIARINGEIVTNGHQDEIVRIDANQWYRFRVAMVDVLAEPDWLSFGSGCEIHQVAADGIWRSSVPGPAKDKFFLTGSSRADFAIRCASSFHILFGGQKAATVYVGAVHPDPFEMYQWTPNRPRSLQGIADAYVPPQNTFDVELTREGINNILWDPAVPLTTVAYDEVHEWTLTRSKTHPFHLHLYHVLVVQPGGCGEQHEEGEFYDSISGTEYEECKVRFKAANFGQRCVLHCHVLNHEDNGAMGWVDVVGDNMPRNDEVSPQYSCPAAHRWTPAPTAANPPTARPTRSPTRKNKNKNKNKEKNASSSNGDAEEDAFSTLADDPGSSAAMGLAASRAALALVLGMAFLFL